MKKVIIFGAGYHGRAALRKCNNSKTLKCICFIDNDNKKNNKVILKKKIYSVEKIKKIQFDKIILCGRYIGEQLKQIIKYRVSKKKILIWGKKDLLPKKKKIIKREKELIKILKFIIKKFDKNKINYWFDYSGLLALIRKQSLAELSDVDISINYKDIWKIKKILSNNKKLFLFYFFYKFYNKKIKKKIIKMFIHGKSSQLIIEPPIIDFVVKKKIKKKIKNINDGKIFSLKHWDTFEIRRYKNLKIKVPNFPEKYLNLVYGNDWRKKKDFWLAEGKN